MLLYDINVIKALKMCKINSVFCFVLFSLCLDNLYLCFLKIYLVFVNIFYSRIQYLLHLTRL